MVLESLEHPFSCFVTLTYNPENIPLDHSVSKRAVQLFLKRLRKEISPRQFRYYAAGEYGEENWRPHYHLILFGISPTEETLITKCWPYGFIQMGTAQQESMSYCASYIVKRMTNAKDSRLNGLNPEFSLMSRKPGIGAASVNTMAEAYQTEAGQALLAKNHWIITKIRTNGSKFPLADYLKRKLVTKLSLTKEQQSEYRIMQMQEAELKRPKTKKERYRQRQSQLAAESGKLSLRRKSL
nr:MAG TPA: Replication associated protein [Microviridae sp.]